MTVPELTGPELVVPELVVPEVTGPGNRLDDDHFPETNGWMAVCRRCGFRTTGGASDHHEPMNDQQARVNRWLAGQRHAARVAEARQKLGT